MVATSGRSHDASTIASLNILERIKVPARNVLPSISFG